MNERQWLSAFAEWATGSRLRFSDQALWQARICLIDTLACIHAGSNTQQTQKILNALEMMHQQGSKFAVNQTPPLSLAAAAMVNGVAAHAIDFDDQELHASTHPSAVLISALLGYGRVEADTAGSFSQGLPGWIRSHNPDRRYTGL